MSQRIVTSVPKPVLKSRMRSSCCIHWAELLERLYNLHDRITHMLLYYIAILLGPGFLGLQSIKLPLRVI